MSMAPFTEIVEYPESDGEPMGETDLHRDWMFRILEILRQRYRGQRVYIASDLLVYYEEGKPSKVVVPDDFIVLDCDPGRRRVFKTWEEKRVPDVVFEVTSSSSRIVDTVKKPAIYELIGVKEYFVYDPTSDYLDPPLEGFRLVDGCMQQFAPTDGVLVCETLQLGLRLAGHELEFIDLRSGKIAVDGIEAEREAKEAEREAKEVERAAKEAEREAKEFERNAKQIERQAREQAEAKNRELMKEIAELKRRLGEQS